MIDKSKIIDAINKTEDEFLLEEINQLLENKIDYPEWHKRILAKRLKDFEEGNSIFYNWEEVKNSIFTS